MAFGPRVRRLVRAQMNAYLNEPDVDVYESEVYQEVGEHEAAHREVFFAEQDAVLAGYYANLELPYGASAKAVKAARRRLLKVYHPDRFARDPDKTEVAAQLVKTLNQAHDELLHWLQREHHD